jgi:hypothetical protein
MKTTLVIPGIAEHEVTPEAYADLVAAYPQGDQINSRDQPFWSVRILDTDPRTEVILEVLKKHNLRLWHGLSNPTEMDIKARYEREYNKKDLAEAQYLSPYFPRTFGLDEGRNSDGWMRKKSEGINPKAQIGGSWGGAVFISIDLKSVVEDEDFIGATILPIELIGMPLKSVEGKFRELSSTIILPRMAPIMSFFSAVRGETREEVDRDHDGPSILREGREDPGIIYELPALHYRRADIVGMEAFDIGLTYERFGMDKPHTVFSQRFYQFCLKHKLPISWIPVYIDE